MERDTTPGIEPKKGIDKRDALEALGRLHTLNFERFDTRRSLEWRVSLTLWGGLVLAANVIKDLDLPRWAGLVGAVLLTGVVVLHAVWEKLYVLRAANANRDEGYRIENTIRATVGIPQIPTPSPINWAAHFWQVGITALLVGLVIASGIWGQ